MPSVPDPTQPAAVIFSSFTAIAIALWLGSFALRSVPILAPGRWLLIFLGLTILSSATAVYFGTPLDLWLRGIIPFLFLIVYFPAVEIARKEPDWLLTIVHLSCIVWLVMTGLQSMGALPAVLAGDVQRITHATDAWASFQLPYAMVGLALTLFHAPGWAAAVRWPLALAFSLMPVLAVSRGQIAVVALVWLTYLLLLPPLRRMKAVALLLILGIAFGSYVGQSYLLESVLARFSEPLHFTESSRYMELEYAAHRFLESPLLGMGLGHQIPAEITFFGDWRTLLDAGVSGVGYMHNVAFYLLMTLGLPGLLSYGAFVLSSLPWWRRRVLDSNLKRVLVAAILTLAVLCAWSMIQPTFRHIQTNVLLAVMIAVLATIGRNAVVRGRA
jgi:O-antigen ligase